MDMAATMHRSTAAVDPENPLDVPGGGPTRPVLVLCQSVGHVDPVLVVAAIPAERPRGDALVAVAARNRRNVATKRRDDAPRSLEPADR